MNGAVPREGPPDADRRSSIIVLPPDYVQVQRDYFMIEE